jgi:molybdopterin molybdotransferase
VSQAPAERPSVTDPEELVPLEEHRRDVLSRIAPLEPIELGLIEAHGCALAEDIVAPEDIPGFANSAMDGYAVNTASVTTDEPIPLAGELAAGAGGQELLAVGSAVRIMTGAPIPPGADAVVPVEFADEEGGTVRFRVAPRQGDHVRPAGGDVRAGTKVLSAGRRIGGADVGMLAAIGRSRVMVRPKPRVAIISTGNELVDVDSPLTPGKIRDSNSFMLTAMARETGSLPHRNPVVRDDRRALAEAFMGALTNADVLVTSGGVSAGRYDLVKEVLAQIGDVQFRKVAMQPGMPQAFGILNPQGPHSIPCFALPGNPVSAYVSFEVFVRPALRRMQGRSDLNRPRVTAVLEEGVSSPAHKVSFLRVKLRRDGTQWLARLTGPQGSGLLHSAVAADGLAEVPADRTKVQAGETVVVHLLGT